MELNKLLTPKNRKGPSNTPSIRESLRRFPLASNQVYGKFEFSFESTLSSVPSFRTPETWSLNNGFFFPLLAWLQEFFFLHFPNVRSIGLSVGELL